MAELVEVGTQLSASAKSVFESLCIAHGITYDDITIKYSILATQIVNKYIALGLRYMEGIDGSKDVLDALLMLKGNKTFPTLVAMTNKFAELSSIPLDDKTVKTYSQDGNTFSMSENQPIDATETITTPYIKVNGKNGYSSTETETHSTVHEYAERQKIAEKTVYSIAAWIEDLVSSVIYEYNYAW